LQARGKQSTSEARVVSEAPGGIPLHGYDLPRLDISVAHPARIFDFWLGGKDNFAVDRQAAEAAAEVFPKAVPAMRANRAFLGRTVRYLAGEAGIRQFLDIGTGLPSEDNTHDVAQAIAPESRVVYVDNDPVVLLHAHAMLTGTAAGATGYIDADLRDPGKILADAGSLLDLSQPVAVLLFGILPFIHDDDSPYAVVDVLMSAMPEGSYLAVSHFANDLFPRQMPAFAHALNKYSSLDMSLRDKAEVSGFFRGLELVEPGVVQVSRWRARIARERDAPAASWGGVGQKPARARAPFARISAP
jgi:S-adenosyl methyltransferase